MRYVKKFEEKSYVDYSTSYGRQQSLNSTKIKNYKSASFKEQFFEKYPKIETKIIFQDREATYDLELFDIIINDENYDLVFRAENGEKVKISNPYSISDNDLLKISLLPVSITDESKNLIDSMFNQ